jgi:hypothetical protein
VDIINNSTTVDSGEVLEINKSLLFFLTTAFPTVNIAMVI